MTNSTEVSYHVATRLPCINVYPRSFGSTLYPAFSKYFLEEKKLVTVFERAILAVISVPVALGTAAIADRLIPFIYGANYTSDSTL